jgi:hypothetical protein
MIGSPFQRSATDKLARLRIQQRSEREWQVFVPFTIPEQQKFQPRNVLIEELFSATTGCLSCFRLPTKFSQHFPLCKFRLRLSMCNIAHETEVPCH